MGVAWLSDPRILRATRWFKKGAVDNCDDRSHLSCRLSLSAHCFLHSLHKESMKEKCECEEPNTLVTPGLWLYESWISSSNKYPSQTRLLKDKNMWLECETLYTLVTPGLWLQKKCVWSTYNTLVRPGLWRKNKCECEEPIYILVTPGLCLLEKCISSTNTLDQVSEGQKYVTQSVKHLMP